MSDKTDHRPPRAGAGEKETGRHAGHADILREQIDGSTGR
ncbi:DUF664 domain-containing protein [Mycolicibacterium tusciae]|nr:DUF664 domain-containing protein [Mycolicibacterium tusciae]